MILDRWDDALTVSIGTTAIILAFSHLSRFGLENSTAWL